MDVKPRKALGWLIVLQTIISMYLVVFHSGSMYSLINTPEHLASPVNLSRTVIRRNGSTIITFHLNNNHTSKRINNTVDNDVKVRVGMCPNLECPRHLISGEWQRVSTSAFVVSAYYLDASAVVVFVGMRVRRSGFQPTCQLWFEHENNVSMEEVPSSASDFPEAKLKYVATLFKCLVPQKQKPTYVSMVTSPCGKPDNLLQVRSTDASAGYKRRFTVCLMPLNYRFSRAFQIVEWIELNRILGAEKFIIYNHTSEYNVGTILEYYSSQGLVDIVQWQLPVVVDTWPPSKPGPEVHYFGQLAVLQDCLYRSKAESEFVVNVDMDEFIIPRGKNVTNWADMFQQLPKDTDSYIFPNAFFRKEWNDTSEDFPNKTVALKYNLVTLLKAKREKKVFRHTLRSKFICKTANVERLHVHDVPASKQHFVPEGIGLLHHYRNWLQYDYPEQDKIPDDSIKQKFLKPLIERILKLWNVFPDLPLDLHTTD